MSDEETREREREGINLRERRDQFERSETTAGIK